MTEAAKTTVLVAIAALVLVAGILTRPQPPKPPAEDKVGKSLFAAKLDDPLKAKRMRIVTYDDAAGKAREFEIAQVDGVWSLPSHKNYPADAKEQMAAAAAALVDLKVLGVASESAADHELYGVVQPDPAKDQLGAKGIGKLVVIEDESKRPLARLIIGKEDKPKSSDDFSATQTKLRFVRAQGQNVVYRAALASDKFSTKFENWIETDLLKLSPWDITQVDQRDYTVSMGISAEGRIAVRLDRRADVDLAFNDQDSKWSLEKLVKYKDGKPAEEKLTDDEELDVTKLNEMKTALDDLKIVDVARKPTQMSANLKVQADFTQDQEAIESLASHGFLPVQIKENEVDILSDNGEAIVGMKDGLEYVLRFGKIAGIDSGGDEQDEQSADSAKADAKADGKDAAADKSDDSAEAKAADDKKPDDQQADDKKGASVNRYVMVMARFNANLLPQPELEPVPEIKKAPDKPAEKQDDTGKKEGAGKAAAKTDTVKTDTVKKADAKPDAAKTEEAKSEVAEKAKADEPEEDLEAQEDRRDKVEKENQRKQEEYDEKVKKGEQRAKELNARFADWYYVISDDTYRKIHLGVDDIIMKKPQEEKADEKTDAATPTDPFKDRGPAGPAKVAPAPAGKK